MPYGYFQRNRTRLWGVKGTVLGGNIACSEMGKQNIQTNKVLLTARLLIIQTAKS